MRQATLTRRIRRAAAASALAMAIGAILAGPALADVTEFPLEAGTGPLAITAGPDGQLWFTAIGGNGIGQITTAGVISIPTAISGSGPTSIVAGPDGAMWYSETASNSIGRMTTGLDLSIPSLALPLTTDPIQPAPFTPRDIASLGGFLWFAEVAGNSIGRTNSIGGPATQFTLANGTAPIGVAAGPDSALWFTEAGTSAIGRMTSGGAVTGEFATPTPASSPSSITAGPDGAMWFTEDNANAIGRITTAGAITEFTIPTAGAHPSAIAAGPDGALWFTESNTNKIGRITPAGTITEFPIPTADSNPSGIAAGADGAMWFTEQATARIGRITVPPPPPAPAPAPAAPVIAAPAKDTTAPVLSKLTFTPATFRAFTSGASIAAAPRGSKVTYTLSENATVSFGFEQVLVGQRKGTRCVKPPKATAKTKAKAKKPKTCKLYIALKGTFPHLGGAGANKLTFRGRVGGKTLKPGSYRVTAIAVDGAGLKSKALRRNIKIVKR